MKSGKSIFIISVLLIAAGVTLYGRQKRAEEKPADETSVRQHSANTDARHFDGLDDVILPAGLPSQKKDYNGFTVSFNKDNHTPNYVSWELLDTETDGPAPRSNRFLTDYDVEGCPQTSDYTRSGYDRGHMAPSADMKWSTEANADCFTLTNICPQAKALNTGAWKTLEQKCRLWARRDSALCIVAGPIYSDSDNQRLGPTGVRVPSAFFKVIIAPYLQSPRGIGFIYPNMSSPGNMKDYSMTIDEVERITGYDFFHNLPDQLENQIESATSFKEWNSQR